MKSTHLKMSRDGIWIRKRHRVMIDGQELGHLTRQEFAILELLLGTSGAGI